MKKKLILLLAVVILFSCSKDEDPIKDPIIGKWKLIKMLDEGDDVTNDCNTKSYVEFLESGITFVKLYEKAGNNCLDIPKREAKWRYVKENVYEIIAEGNEAEQITVKFIENNTKFITEDGSIWKKE